MADPPPRGPAPPLPLRIVFFDLGGTLINNHDFVGWASIAQSQGLAVDADHLAHAFHEVEAEIDNAAPPPPWEEYWAKILGKAGGGNVPIDAAARFLGEVEQRPRVVHVYSDVRICLEEVAELGLRTGIISNSRSESQVRDLLALAGVPGQFDPIVSSGTEGIRKPDPGIFRRAVERARVAADEAFHIGDLRFTDALAARAAGLRSAWLNREGTGFGDDPPEITSLSELPGHLQLSGLVSARLAPVKYRTFLAAPTAPVPLREGGNRAPPRRAGDS